MNRYLRRAIEIVAFKDSQPFRQQVFRDLKRHNRPVRAAVALHRRLGTGRLSTLFVSAYGARAFLSARLPPGEPPIIALNRYKNERRQLDWVAGLLGPGQVGFADVSTRGLRHGAAWLALAGQLLPGGQGGTFWRAVRDQNQAGDFLVSCRVAATCAYFLRFRELLRETKASAVLVSSDSNPYAMGLAWAAKELDLKTIYITHGHIPDGPPRASFDLSLLDGSALVEVYRDSHGLDGRVVFKGAEGRFRPMDTSGLGRAEGLRVGVFMSLVVDWRKFSDMFARIQHALRPASVLVRLHPNETIRDPDCERWIGRWDNLEISRGDSVLLEDAARCDLVLAGNSSCHLSLLKYGVPSAYVPELDTVPHDFYRFLARRIVYEADAPEAIDLGQLATFYDDPEWAERFRAFDASYGRDVVVLEAEVRAALEEELS